MGKKEPHHERLKEKKKNWECTRGPVKGRLNDLKLPALHLVPTLLKNLHLQREWENALSFFVRKKRKPYKDSITEE